MIMIEEWELLAIMAAEAIAILVFGYGYIRGNMYEALLMKRCRDKGLPMARIHWGNFRESHEALEKDDDGDWGFSKGGHFFKLDIRKYAKGESSWYDGVEMIDYWTDALLPIGPMDARAIFQSIDVIKDKIKYPLLSAMNINNAMTLVYKDEKELSDDIANYIDTEEAKKPDVVSKLKEEIKKAKEALAVLPLTSGNFTYPIAMAAINNRLANKAKDELELAIMKKMYDAQANKEKMQLMGMIIIGIIGASGVAVYIASMAFHH